MAELGTIIETNADKFDEESKTNTTQSFESIQKTLGDLGFDVLINPREGDVDFIDYARFDQVVKQKNGFKTELDTANATLATMIKDATGNKPLQDQLQEMINTNTKLMENNDKMSMNNAIIMAAGDAIDPSDILLFIDRSSVKKDTKGNYKNIDAAVDILRETKPHLFKDTQNKRGGKDPNGNKGGEKGQTDMNSLLRAAAGYARTF